MATGGETGRGIRLAKTFHVIYGNNLLSAQLLEKCPIRSRDGAPSPKGCMVNYHTTQGQQHMITLPPPSPPLFPLPIFPPTIISPNPTPRACNAIAGAGTSSIGSSRPPHGGGVVPQDGQPVPGPHCRGGFAGVPRGVAYLGGAAFRDGFQRQRRWVDA